MSFIYLIEGEEEMDKKLLELAERTFRLEEDEGEDKVMSLEEAIKRNVKPGMILHVTAWSAQREILRQFWGTKPGFTLVSPGKLSSTLVYCGLVKKIIGSSVGIGVYGSGENDVPIEIWSVAGVSQRLLAGALGTGFIPTHSMMGTSIAEDNKDSYKVIDDPFGSGKKVGAIKALNPELTIIHGWAADRFGNTILPPNTPEWVGLASKNGVVVTVEKLVSTAFIRKHSPLLVKIPGYRVNAVSVVPLGEHPASLDNWRDLMEFQGYGDDGDFIVKNQEAAKDTKTFNAWLKEWVLDCPSQEEYLRKLGFERIQVLRDKARVDLAEYRLPFILDKISLSPEFNQREAMITAAGRKIRETVLRNNYRVMIPGLGTASLASYLAYFQLKKEGYDVAIMRGDGVFDYVPQPGETQLGSFLNCNNAKIRTNPVWSYDLITSGENQRSISLLSAAQIDKFGNLNSGIQDGKIFLSGPGGALDAYQACETMAVMPQSKNRFLDRVPYITSVGTRVRSLVSTLGVFEKLGNDEEFTLTGCLPNVKFPTPEQKIDNIKENCGWELKVSPEVEEVPRPTIDELTILRIIDPDGMYRGQ